MFFLYSVGFLGDFGVPKSLDSPPQIHYLRAAGVNLMLLLVFALQHSVMARPAFKAWWTRFIPKPIERSTYVLFSNLAMILIFACWQPIGGYAWKVESVGGQAVLYSLYAIGWLIVLYSTFLINHFDLFGLRQVYLHFKGKPYTQLPFRTPSLYRYVRHPLYVGWIMVSWFTPTMSWAHILFSVGITAYILVAIRFEERDLVAGLDGYSEYRKRVPMLVPRIDVGNSSQVENASASS